MAWWGAEVEVLGVVECRELQTSPYVYLLSGLVPWSKPPSLSEAVKWGPWRF